MGASAESGRGKELTLQPLPDYLSEAMGIDELNDAIESWSYIEDKLRRARNREVYGLAEWEKFDNQLASVSRHLDKLEARRDQLRKPIPVMPPIAQPVKFVSIEAV